MSTLTELLVTGRDRRVYSAAAWSVGTADGPLDRGWIGTEAGTARHSPATSCGTSPR